MRSMKKTLLGVMTLAALGGAALPALAKPMPTKPAPVAAGAEAHKPMHLMGTVVSASAKDHAITLKGADGEHVVAVSPKAVIKRDGKPATLSEVRAGQKIDATVHEVGGKPTAEAITISS